SASFPLLLCLFLLPSTAASPTLFPTLSLHDALPIWVPPGSTFEHHSGCPSAVARNWMLPQNVRCLPEYQRCTARPALGPLVLITFPATRVVRIAVPSTITWVSPAASR